MTHELILNRDLMYIDFSKIVVSVRSLKNSPGKSQSKRNFEILLLVSFKILTGYLYMRSSSNIVKRSLQDRMERSSINLYSASSCNLVTSYMQHLIGKVFNRPPIIRKNISVFNQSIQSFESPKI